MNRRLPFAALLACGLGCGGFSPNQADPNEGAAYPGTSATDPGFDAKFQPQTSKTLCPNGACYPAQLGYAHGKPIYFYNLGAITTSFAQTCPGNPPQPACLDSQGREVFSASLATNHVYEFAAGGCTPDPNGYDPVYEAYDPTVQYPVFSQLPLAVSSFANPVVPIGWVTTVEGVSGDTCNDIKTAASIGGATCTKNQDCGPTGSCSSGTCQGHFGATSVQSQALATTYGMFAAVDMTANFPPLLAADQKTPLPNQPLHYAWSGDLQTAYLAGGPVTVDGISNLVSMDGIIIDPPGKFSKTTDTGTVILPFAPNEPGYSPIVRLHDYTLQVGQSVGDFRDICPQTGCPPGAPANQVDPTRATASAFNNIFVVAVGQ